MGLFATLEALLRFSIDDRLEGGGRSASGEFSWLKKFCINPSRFQSAFGDLLGEVSGLFISGDNIV